MVWDVEDGAAAGDVEPSFIVFISMIGISNGLAFVKTCPRRRKEEEERKKKERTYL